jgi:hypothetical protein
MRRHVENNWRGVPDAQLKTYRSRLRGNAIQSLADLALIAEREPEDQLSQTFTPTTLKPLIHALTGHGCYEISSRHYEIAKTMLDASISRLQALIDPDYQPIVAPSLEKDVYLLRVLQAPTTPREGLEKRSLSTVKAQREQTSKERRSLNDEYLRSRFL